MFMIRYNQEREVIGMKFIMKNKGVLLFYLIIIVSSLIIINDVERDNVLNNNDNTYVAIIQKYYISSFNTLICISFYHFLIHIIN